MSKAKRINHKPVYKTSKLTLLYIFLVPMLISVVQSLFSSDYYGFILKTMGFAMLYGSISLAKKGFLYKEEYERSKLAKAPKTPYLKLAAIGLGITLLSISFFIGGKSILASLFIGILAVIGFYLYYGFDPKEDKVDNIDGISVELVLNSIKEAKEKLASIRQDMKSIDDKILNNKLSVAVKKAEVILETIQEDPKDIRVARKFLIVYIDGIAKVTKSYTQLDEKDINRETSNKLYTLLDNVQSKFDSELNRLKENNQFDLDVHIDVLKKQIKH
ncbi:MAG: hypothetical protein HF962_00080 [Sulfurovum sp.]|nr:hypothetical protein [Sulfurovum sp.]